VTVRVGLLECDHVADRFRAIAGDYGDMFDAAFPALDLVRYDVVEGRLPASADECDGWMVTGSRYAAYDDEPWVHALTGFVRDVAASDRPFVGICFGHQVLAQALGGTVEKAATGWGVGPHVTEFIQTGPSTLLYMHEDQVVEVPPGATVIGSTDHCPVAALQRGSVVGVQAHPEFGPDYVEALLAERVERIGADKAAAARAALAAATSLDSGLVAQSLQRHLTTRSPI